MGLASIVVDRKRQATVVSKSAGEEARRNAGAIAV
jgi:hypothetical protein